MYILLNKLRKEDPIGHYLLHIGVYSIQLFMAQSEIVKMCQIAVHLFQEKCPTSWDVCLSNQINKSRWNTIVLIVEPGAWTLEA